MHPLPEPTPTAPAAGQATNPLTDAVIQAAVRDAIHQTSYRDTAPIPAVGATPPVPQPGRPPMSEKATDDSVRMISAGFLTLCAGTATAGVLHFSSDADPTVIALMAAVPAGLAVPILALSRLVKRVKETVEAAPAEIHQHYNGTVIQDHRSLNTTTRGIVASTRNQTPR